MNAGHHWFKQMRKTVRLLFGSGLAHPSTAAHTQPPHGRSGASQRNPAQSAASQVNASQVNASQVNASQVNASQVNASQVNASQVNASQLIALQSNPAQSSPFEATPPQPAAARPAFDLPNAVFDTPPVPARIPAGAHFMSGVYANDAGSRTYKLYVPSCWKGQALPLVVMLHGCAQDPDDFAAGTRMNAVAEERRCFVVYPAQSADANSSRCWNWFSALDQKHGQGEPSIIAGIARDIVDTYPVAPGQVYIAGLSAGGAMAAIVGTLYPELFAAVGVHSGLPFAAARDLPSALSAMKRGASAREAKSAGLPIIVFHGDQDKTVHPANGDELMAQGLRSHPLGTKAQPSRLAGRVPDGHAYTRTKHWLHDGSPLAEHWVIHGAGHAWSGGSPAGSYTDGKGPDASREMMRFFATVRGG